MSEGGRQFSGDVRYKNHDTIPDGVYDKLSVVLSSGRSVVIVVPRGMNQSETKECCNELAEVYQMVFNLHAGKSEDLAVHEPFSVEQAVATVLYQTAWASFRNTGKFERSMDEVRSRFGAKVAHFTTDHLNHMLGWFVQDSSGDEELRNKLALSLVATMAPLVASGDISVSSELHGTIENLMGPVMRGFALSEPKQTTGLHLVKPLKEDP